MTREERDGKLSPHAYMLRVMRNPQNSQEVRLEAARAAAPYSHPRLAQVEHGVKNEVLDAVTELVGAVQNVDRGVGGLLKRGRQS